MNPQYFGFDEVYMPVYGKFVYCQTLKFVVHLEQNPRKIVSHE